MLAKLQHRISQLYDVPMRSSVEDFLCDESTVTATLGSATVERREILIVAEDSDSVSVGLYVAQAMLDAIEGVETKRGSGAKEWTDAHFVALEGVSHFVYFMFRAENAFSVTQLELELQAEVDKYATGLCSDTAEASADANHDAAMLLAGQGIEVIRRRSQALRERLFEGVRFVDAHDTEEGERYRHAHRSAALYTRRLEERYLERGDVDAFVRELRRFYRLGSREKLETAGRGRVP